MLFVKCVNYLIKKECDASGSFMLNPQNKRKDENDKIYDWRLELSFYGFDIVFCPGKDNIVVDTFIRIYCLVPNTNTL